ncbi:MAG TPA: hypothetical protein VIZ62_04510 [Nitrososphaeraceae archaeon]
MSECKKSNLETILTKALSNALLDLGPLKNSYSNRNLTIEIRILQWMLDIVPKLRHNLYFLKEVVKNEIDNFKVKYYYAKDKNDIDEMDTLSKSIEILQTCLFLITKESEFNQLYSINGKIKR